MSRGRTARIAWIALLVALITLLIASPSLSSTAEVRVLTVNGIINPVTARYVSRELTEAALAKADAVVLTLDSPGGLESSMRQIVEAMLNSPVPIITYVSPHGARAASAGMFIAIAGQVAAMAPGTNIGAAHPIAMGGREKNVSGALEEKILNDAAALARSIANERGRNAAWAEDAVRRSVSISATEALRLGVTDLIAENLDDLLRKVDGKLAQARVVERPMTFPERLLQALTDPNIAYILLTIGFIAIIAEVYHPGLILPGAIGLLSLLLGYVALGSLPINWVGIIFLVVGIGLLIAEVHAPTLGALGTIGFSAFVLGSIMLYRPIRPTSPVMAHVFVSPWVLAAMSLLVAGFFLGVLRAAWAARHRPVFTGPEALIGTVGVAESDLEPAGIVNLRGERWTAEASPQDGPRVIRTGEPVEVLGVKGVTLKVRRKR